MNDEKLAKLDAYILVNNVKGNPNFYRELTLQSMFTDPLNPGLITGAESSCKKLTKILKMIKHANKFRKTRIGSFIYNPDNPHKLWVKTKDADIDIVDCIAVVAKTGGEFQTTKMAFEIREKELKGKKIMKGLD